MEPSKPVLPAIRPGLPKRILFGFMLAGIGVAFTGASWAWNYFGIRSSFFGTFTTFIQVEILLAVAENLCLQMGLFLILGGILSSLPRVHPWSRLGPLLILVGALVLVAVAFTQLELVSVTYSVGSDNGLLWLGEVLQGAGLAGEVAITLGLVVSLFAIAKVLLLRPAPPAAPLPP